MAPSPPRHKSHRPTRKEQKRRRGGDFIYDLTFSQAAVILNAKVAGKKKVRARPLMTEDTFKELSTDDERNRRLNKASDLVTEWLDPGNSFPFGTARFLCFGPAVVKVSRALGLYDKAVNVFKQHNDDCPDDCESLLHPGNVVPPGLETSIAMISVLDSSMSNFSAVVATDPQLLHNAMIRYDSSNGLIIPPEATAGLTAQEEIELQKISIFNLPGTLGSGHGPQGTKNFVNDLLFEDMIAGIRNISLDTCTKEILCFQNDKFKFKLSFKRLLQHWAVSENIAHNSITRFLRLLHFYKPETICYASLPRTGKALLSTSDNKLAECGFGKKDAPCQLNDELSDCHCKPTCVQCCKIRPIVIDNKLKPGHKFMLGRYVHFGLEKAVTGKSIGLLHRFHYRLLLRHIHQVRPGFLPDFFLDITKPQEDEPFDRSTWEKWIKPKQNDPLSCGKPAEPIVFQVRINVDGAQFFESSHIKGIPIQGKLVGIRSLSGDFKFSVPYDLGKPFIIGIFEQTAGKPPGFLLMEDTIREMMALHPSNLLGQGNNEHDDCKSYAVEVVCFNCDAPMRSDLKGTKSCNGYYGCERCETKGEYHETKGATAPMSCWDLDNAAPVPALLVKSSVKPKFVKRITENFIDATGKRTQKVQWIRVPRVIVNRQQPSGSRSRLDDQQQTGQQDDDHSTFMGDNQDVQDPSPCGSNLSAVTSSTSAASPITEGPSSSSAAVDDAKSNNNKGRKNRKRSALPKSQVVLSQKKQRQQAYDDGFEDGADDDDYEEPFDDVNTTSQQSAAANSANNARPVLPAVAQSQPAKKGVTGGGSIYFPEIGATPRTDKYWPTYRHVMSQEEVITFSIFPFFFI
jgi:hypothetical protein